MAGKTTPWWREVLTRTVRGIRAGVAALLRPAKKRADVSAAISKQENIPEEETVLSENFPNSRPEQAFDPEIENPVVAPQASGEAREATRPDSQPAGSADPPISSTDLLAEAALGTEGVPEAVREMGSAAEPQPASNPNRLEIEDVDASFVPGATVEPEEPKLAHDPLSGEELIPRRATEETVAPQEIETEATAAEPDLEAAPEAFLEEREMVLPAQLSENQFAAQHPHEAALSQPDRVEAPATPDPTQPKGAEAPTPQQPPQAAPVQPQALASPKAPAPPQSASAAPQAPPAPHEAIKREQSPDTSPVSVIVSHVYEGPFDLLLDLIRKQDIDIYDIPIAKITAQFLAYVNQLRASDMDVAGEFIYTASLLIHIKSRMLLPREPREADDAQEDPRRELVERLLEHERFKNAAQMLQQKQMLAAATWTNPGVREFREDAGEGSEVAPEIAADTTDLVRVFRDILERARNRPVIDMAEDTVTVGQMVKFLSRRLTMEDKPVALRRLLAHTKSERALIAMFLALLELVRLQAIVLRQDRHFSEIFIKKSSGFEAVMNQGLARDDWQ